MLESESRRNRRRVSRECVYVLERERERDERGRGERKRERERVDGHLIRSPSTATN